MRELGFRTLRFFLALQDAGSVSHAAAQIGVGQPSGSAMLARLRRYFGDPLFVPSGRRMVPTARAKEIVQPVERALQLIEAARDASAVFDPQRSTRRFIIAMTDISQITLLPRLYRALEARKSGVTLAVQELNEQTPEMLARGAADLAIGFITQIGPGFLQQKLLQQKYVCIARRGHPRLKAPLTLKTYLAEKHIQISAAGIGHGLIDATLRRRKLARPIALSLPSFLGVRPIVARTDLVATVPVEMAKELAADSACTIYALPFTSAEFAVRQYWHAQTDTDQGHRWLRTQVAESIRPGK